MKPYITRLLIVVLLFLTVLLLVRSFDEQFIDMSPETINFITKSKMPENMPDPKVIIKSLRTMLDKYDNGEFIDHAAKVHAMDPGQLARMHMGIIN